MTLRLKIARFFRSIVHTCSCKRMYTLAQWRRLPLVGYQDDGIERLEIRNCPCHSTRALLVDENNEPIGEDDEDL